MGFKSTIIVVEDVLRSRGLYENMLGLTVEEDHGEWNVGFAGGLALYKKALFGELTGNVEILDKPNSFVLYFEVENIDELEGIIRGEGFAFVHGTREQPWAQRTFRFYDYDNHMLEIAEDMVLVHKRLYTELGSVDAVAAKTGIPADRITEQLGLS